MELLKDVIVDFCLFSLIEGIIYAMFFHRVCGLKSMGFKEILILSLGNCLISSSGVFPPLMYQIIMIGYMSFILKKINETNILKCLKCTIFSVIFILVTEISFTIILEQLSLVSLLETKNSLLVFLFLLPVRFLQIGIMKGVEKYENLGWNNKKTI
ncbi:MAG: hypothetical protein ACRCTZ_21070 [Sarcina sp.]